MAEHDGCKFAFVPTVTKHIMLNQECEETQQPSTKEPGRWLITWHTSTTVYLTRCSQIFSYPMSTISNSVAQAGFTQLHQSIFQTRQCLTIPPPRAQSKLQSLPDLKSAQINRCTTCTSVQCAHPALKSRYFRLSYGPSQSVIMIKHIASM